MFRVSVLALGLAPALACAQPLEPDQLPEAMTPLPTPRAISGIAGGEGTGSPPVSCGLGPRNDPTPVSSDREPSRADSTTHQ